MNIYRTILSITAALGVCAVPHTASAITYTYARLRAESDLTYTVEISTSLVHAAWQQTGSSATGESILGDDLVEVVNRIDDVHEAAAVRLRIRETPAP